MEAFSNQMHQKMSNLIYITMAFIKLIFLHKVWYQRQKQNQYHLLPKAVQHQQFSFNQYFWWLCNNHYLHFKNCFWICKCKQALNIIKLQCHIKHTFIYKLSIKQLNSKLIGILYFNHWESILTFNNILTFKLWNLQSFRLIYKMQAYIL